jgi:hypothetical protein
MLTISLNVHSVVVVVVDCKEHLPPCDCGDCRNCHKYGPGPADLRDMVGVFPNVESLWVQWHGNRTSGPPLTRHSRHQDSFESLTNLKIWIRDDPENRAQNLLKDAAEIVHHFRFPVLEKLVLDVRVIPSSVMFIEGCKRMTRVVSKIESTTFKSFEMEIHELHVRQLPQPPIWVSWISVDRSRS